jgi:hypothetical protein
MEAKLAEYRARKHKEAAKQFLYNIVMLNSQQHVSDTTQNLSPSTPREVRCILLRFSRKQLNI